MANESDTNQVLEEEYDEDGDDDFNPDAKAADKQQSSSDDSELEQQTGEGSRIKSVFKSKEISRLDDHPKMESGDLDFENSGDEGIIKEGTTRERKRKRKRKVDEQDEDSGGEGGFVKTRSMRAVAYVNSTDDNSLELIDS